jgi:Predicted membrane protein
MHQSNTRPTVEAGVMSAVAIVFALISAYVPVIGAFVTFLWPVPIILLGVRHGFRWSVLATAAAGIMSAILIQPLQAAQIVIGFGLIGLVFGHAFRSGFGPFKTILWGSVACLISNLALLGLTLLVMGVNPFDMQLEAMDKALGPVSEFYRGLGVSETVIAQMADQMKMLTTLFKLLIPAGLVMGAAVQTYLNFVVARAVLRKLGHTVPSFPPFKEWTLPRPMLYFAVLAVGILYLGQTMQQDFVYKTGINLQWITAILLFGQGLALFYFLGDKYNLSRLMRNIILIMILTSGLLQVMLIFAGAFDLAVDYRHLKASRSP